MSSLVGSTQIFSRKINLVESPDLDALVRSLHHQQPVSIYFCNVHMLMLSQDDPALADAMDSADFLFADGVPVSWLQSRLSGSRAQTIRGYQVMLAVCRHAVSNNESIGLLGSTPEVMSELNQRLSEMFEGLSIAYQHCPPFSSGPLLTSEAELDSINEAGVSWLFVGLGCPKQEKWISTYKNGLNCKILAVGAAFDWLAGTARKPPGWMEKRGLAWLYRLFQNPKRMWHRYLIYNTKFIFKSAQALLMRDKQQ